MSPPENLVRRDAEHHTRGRVCSPELSSVSNEHSEFRFRHFPTLKAPRLAILSREHTYLWDYLLKNSKHCGISKQMSCKICTERSSS